VNFINFDPANCGTRSTRDFWTRSICLTNGIIRKTRFIDCLGHSAILNRPAVGQDRVASPPSSTRNVNSFQRRNVGRTSATNSSRIPTLYGARVSPIDHIELANRGLRGTVRADSDIVTINQAAVPNHRALYWASLSQPREMIPCAYHRGAVRVLDLDPVPRRPGHCRAQSAAPNE
jgi:hypothetical protein